MQAGDVIREVSVDLNDQMPGYEYTRWSVPQLQSYLREALIDVSMKLSYLFVGRVVVRVNTVAGWQVADCGCTHIKRVIGEATSDGTLLRYLTRRADIEENVWAGPVGQRCPISPKDYVMSGYMVNALDDQEFQVFPPVPPGLNKYVLVECYKRPDGLSAGESVPDESVAMVKQWMLYRALSIDSENNPTIIDLARTHQKTYFDLLQAAVVQRELEKSDDDSRVRAVQKSAS